MRTTLNAPGLQSSFPGMTPSCRILTGAGDTSLDRNWHPLLHKLFGPEKDSRLASALAFWDEKGEASSFLEKLPQAGTLQNETKEF